MIIVWLYLPLIVVSLLIRTCKIQVLPKALTRPGLFSGFSGVSVWSATFHCCHLPTVHHAATTFICSKAVDANFSFDVCLKFASD